MANNIVLATASYDHTIKMFDPHSGKSWLTIKVPDTQVNALALRYVCVCLCCSFVVVVVVKLTPSPPIP